MAVSHQLLVDGMHCPSCVRHIEELLEEHQLGDIVVSLYAGTVSFSHAASLDLKPIYRELEDAGFKAVKPEKQTSPGEMIQHPHTSRPRPIRWLGSMLPHKRHQRKKHREVCEACRAEDDGDALLQDHKSLPPSPQQKARWVRSVFSVEGMTCGSCVSSLKAGLQDDAIRSIEVTLLPGRAVIEHDSQRKTVEQIEETISDLGYEPTLEFSSTIDSAPKSTKWQAKLSVTGMTCASCTGSVKHALEQIDGASDISIDLASGLTTVTLQEERDASLASEDIKDIGFECEIIEVKSLNEKAEERDKTSSRTIRMRVDGMFCHECVGKVDDRFRHLTEEHPGLSMSPVTLRSPFTVISYPVASSIRLRAIRQDIWQLGFGFAPAPLDTIEQRAARARAKERRGIAMRLIIAFLFAIPTFIISVLMMSLLPASNSSREYMEEPVWGMASRGEVAMWALATPVQFGIGAFFYTRSWKSLRAVWRRRRTNASWQSVLVHRLFRWGSMDTLVALGTSLAYASSLAFLALDVTSQTMLSSMGYFDVPIFLIFFILAGRYLEAVSKQYTGDAVSELNKTKAMKGLLFTPGDEQKGSTTEEVETAFLEVGDLVLVPAGASPPLDGILVENSSSTTFDESTLTGEARPVLKKPGDPVYAGTINKGPSAATVELTTMAGQSMVDGIASAVRDAMSKKAGIERIADTITAFFVPAIVGIACFTFVVWILRGYTGGLPEDWLGADPRGGWALFALEFAIAVLVVACPCGIGLAAPTAQLVGVGLAAKHGILPNGGGEAFQAFWRANTLILDKTGTLTTSDFRVADVELLSEDHGVIWAAASAIEATSSHPLSVGLRKRCVEELSKSGSPLNVEVTYSEEIAGRGLYAIIGTHKGESMQILIGNEALIKERDAEDATPALQDKVKGWQTEAKSVIFMAMRPNEVPNARYRICALFSMQDPPRPEAAAVIAELKKRGITTWMCTGDNQVTARAVAASVGIASENVVADALPEDKRDLVRRLQEKGGKRNYVAFCGDGINDSPALAQADAGIAMGSGSAVALKAAHFALVGSSLLGLVTLRALSRSTIHKIYSNFVWASFYNCALIPIAAGAFYDLGQTRLPAVWASLAMALSSVSVVTNSLFLRILFRTPKLVREWQ